MDSIGDVETLLIPRGREPDRKRQLLSASFP